MNTFLFRELIPLRVGGRAVAKPASEMSILSFGCSRGDELMTLCALFPGAKVQGCDINPVALAAAEPVTPFADVFVSDESEIRKRGKYDMICALSSLCHFPLPKEKPLASVFSFGRFDELIGLFGDCLNPGGVIVLQNANYLFRSTAVASQFQPVRSPQIVKSTFVDLFSSKGIHLLKSGFTSFDEYHEILDPDELQDDDLRDCVFMKTKYPIEDVVFRVTLAPEWKKIATWERTNLQNLPEQVRRRCLEIVTQFHGFVNLNNGDVITEQYYRRQKLREAGYYNLGPVYVSDKHRLF